VDSNSLSLDIYYNKEVATKKPIVIFVHGGGWAIGDKADQIQNKATLFQSLNYVFVSINYRLSPIPYELNNPNRIKYPTHNNDVADAIKWVVDNIEQYGGNPNKIALLGHSAGAQLVALTGTNKSFLENVGLSLSALKGVAVIDTKGYDVLDLVLNNKNLYINAFGTNSAENIAASPLYQMENGVTYPSFFIAKRGSTQRLAIANDFIDSLESKGVSVSQVKASIYTHTGINKAIGKPNETKITNPLKDFFAECFN
jgi:pimeloyl-ACP methyl ester carboxylesterase